MDIMKMIEQKDLLSFSQTFYPLPFLLLLYLLLLQQM